MLQSCSGQDTGFMESLGAALLLGGLLWSLQAHCPSRQNELQGHFQTVFGQHSILSDKSAARKRKTCYGGLRKVLSPL